MPFKRNLLTWAEDFVKSPEFAALNEQQKQAHLTFLDRVKHGYEQNRCKCCGQPDNEERPCNCIRLPENNELYSGVSG